MTGILAMSRMTTHQRREQAIRDALKPGGPLPVWERVYRAIEPPEPEEPDDWSEVIWVDDTGEFVNGLRRHASNN